MSDQETGFIPSLFMVERKLGKRGERQYVVGLPTSWVRYNKMRQGNRIQIFASADGKDLILRKAE